MQEAENCAHRSTTWKSHDTDCAPFKRNVDVARLSGANVAAVGMDVPQTMMQ